MGAKDSDSGPMLVQQVHYQKSHRLNPIGEDLNFIFLVMAVLLIYLFRFFSGLCVLVEGMSICVGLCERCVCCLGMGTQGVQVHVDTYDMCSETQN